MLSGYRARPMPRWDPWQQTTLPYGEREDHMRKFFHVVLFVLLFLVPAIAQEVQHPPFVTPDGREIYTLLPDAEKRVINQAEIQAECVYYNRAGGVEDFVIYIAAAISSIQLITLEEGGGCQKGDTLIRYTTRSNLRDIPKEVAAECVPPKITEKKATVETPHEDDLQDAPVSILEDDNAEKVHPDFAPPLPRPRPVQVRVRPNPVSVQPNIVTPIQPVNRSR